MELFKISAPGSHPELYDLTDLTEIELGEDCRGYGRAIVPICGEGADLRAAKRGEQIILVRGDKADDADGRCLAVINTVGGYDRIRSYKLHEAEGVQSIAEGSERFGDAGRINGGPVILAIVSPGATFRLNSKYQCHWYTWSGAEWTQETPEERQARLALSALEQGEEVEWL